MKKYLIDKGFGIQCKNKLQKEIDAITDGYRRVVINEDEFADTLRIISKQVDELNSIHSRCKAETVNHYKSFGDDLSITVGASDTFVKLTFLKFEEI